MTPDPAAVQAVIREVAETLILPRFQRLAAHEISEKKAGDIVTIADQEAEHALEAALRKLLPGSAVVGEEAVSARPAALDALGGDGPVWIVDPVDGTQNFADGKPCFAVIVALAEHGETVAGWIYEPVAATTIWAIRGEGAYEDGVQLRLGAPKQMRKFTGSLNRRHHQRLKQSGDAVEREIGERATRYRCVGAEYADLARGKLDFARYGGPIKPWDHAAGVLIHAEAGGYGAIAETGKPYRPVPTLNPQTLLLAPSEGNWRSLFDLLER
jgi:fructose-1,6-bisphosphatase/inositol monophosphatase family enzyme